jgi:hypothetical protein
MHRIVAAVLLCLVAISGDAQERPLPDARLFLQEVRQHLDTDDERQSGYMYVQTRREQKLDKAGRPTSESVKVSESYPALPGEERWARLLSEDGRPVPPNDLEKGDRDRQKHVEEYARQLAKDPAQMRAKQDRERERNRHERAESIDDVFRVLDAHGSASRTTSWSGSTSRRSTPCRSASACSRACTRGRRRPFSVGR